MRQEIEHLKSLIDLASVIMSDGIELVDLGNNWRGLCPFHTERTPSFIVHKDFNRYRCWGCGAAGDIFDWLRVRKGLSFKQALQFLRGTIATVDDSTTTKSSIPESIHANKYRNFQQQIDENQEKLKITNGLTMYFGLKLYNNWMDSKNGCIEPSVFYTRNHYYEYLLGELDSERSAILHRIIGLKKERSQALKQEYQKVGRLQR